MKHLLGPELFWLLLYLGAMTLGKANTSKAVEDFIQTSWFWIPASSLLVFGLWWMPSVEKSAWLFLRVWIVGIVACYLVAEKAISASSFQNSGAGMGLVGAVCIQVFILIVGTIAIGIKAIWFK
jgi:hypothetical protein